MAISVIQTRRGISLSGSSVRIAQRSVSSVSIRTPHAGSTAREIFELPMIPGLFGQLSASPFLRPGQNLSPSRPLTLAIDHLHRSRRRRAEFPVRGRVEAISLSEVPVRPPSKSLPLQAPAILPVCPALRAGRFTSGSKRECNVVHDLPFGDRAKAAVRTSGGGYSRAGRTRRRGCRGCSSASRSRMRRSGARSLHTGVRRGSGLRQPQPSVMNPAP